LSQLKPADRNDLLKILNDDWRAWPERPRVRCAYENRSTRGVMIVKWSSGTRFCDEPPVEVSADHIDIVKPDGPNHLAVVTVTNALRELVLDPALEPRLEMPALKEEGDHLVLELDRLNVSAPVINSGGKPVRCSAVAASHDARVLGPRHPLELPPGSRDNIWVLLTDPAIQAEYQFKLRTSIRPDRIVKVRIPDVRRLQAHQQQLMQGAVAAVLQHVSDRRATDLRFDGNADARRGATGRRAPTGRPRGRHGAGNAAARPAPAGDPRPALLRIEP